MVKAEYNSKTLVVDILTKSFDTNQSVNYIINQDEKRKKRIKNLMEYSFGVCYLFGKVFLSDDKKSCALIVLPDKKKTTLRSILLDIKLIFSCITFSNVNRAMKREAKIKKLQPKDLMYYLWFIGVQPKHQGMTIWLQNAQKTLENQMSKLKLKEIGDWANKQKELYATFQALKFLPRSSG